MNIKSVRYEQQQQGNWSEQIANALKEIKFGSIEIIIHNGKVVQIEKKEKIRFSTDQQL